MPAASGAAWCICHMSGAHLSAGFAKVPKVIKIAEGCGKANGKGMHRSDSWINNKLKINEFERICQILFILFVELKR